MADRDQFFGLMSEFGGLLGKLDSELYQLGSTRFVHAAQTHTRQSRAWINDILGAATPVPEALPHLDDAGGQYFIGGFDQARNAIEQRNFTSPDGIVYTFGVIDQALTQAYEWMQASGIEHIVRIGPPSTYDKVLSVLPGDPYLPTDPEPEISTGIVDTRFPKRPDWDDGAASFLPGDPEFPTDPEPPRKRSSDDFLP